MIIEEDQLDLITPQILPPGCNFFSQQKAAIFANGSVNIVAGPGSGKTTVLIAKCALLLKQNYKRNKGICLITHTNVAVDEIKTGLKKVGINNVEYPNFIGTIQEFFNTFFAKKAFHHIHGDKRFRVLDDEEYKEKFGDLFEEFKPNWYTFSPPNISRGNPRLKINDDLSFSVTSDANPSYKDAFEMCIKILFKRGFVDNLQCLELADWYISKYEKLIKSAISKRFKYVLLDEAQDTSQLQYILLNKLFLDSRVSFQKFGDPYQSLYNIYDDNIDAWVPSKELNVTYQEISETSRFGNNIANIVKNICIEKYDTFRSLELIQSFNPHYILFDNEEDLLMQYRALINSCESESESFFHSSKKDAILSAFHEDLIQLFPQKYTRPSIKPRKNESQIRKIYNLLLGILSKEMDISFKELKDKVDSRLDCKEKISSCIKGMVDEAFPLDALILKIEDLLITLTNNRVSQFLKVNIESQLEYFRKTSLTSDTSHLQEEHTEFFFGTIHSAKGETHRSTLLVLNTVFKDFQKNSTTEFLMFDLLKEYLVGNYIDPKTIEDTIKRNETKKALKLAYVALSRPTHLMAIAIPKNFVVEDNTLERMNNSGWKLYEQIVYS